MTVTIEHPAILTQIMTRGFHEASKELQHLLAMHVVLQASSIALLASYELQHAIRHHDTQQFLAIRLELHAASNGWLAFLLPVASAVQVVASVTGKTPPDAALDTMGLGMLSEIGLTMLTPVAQALLHVIPPPVQFDLPPTITGSLAHILRTVCTETSSKACLAQLSCLFGPLQTEGHVLFLWTPSPCASRVAVMATAHNGGDNDDV
jgi:chemotaxis protein CheY-P-specific phosphatase CheC